MQLFDGKLIFSASDLTDFLACEHLTQLKLAELRGECSCPALSSPDLEILTCRGNQHEVKYLEDLRSKGLSLVEIDNTPGIQGSLAGAEKTMEAMKNGADVIYQATFFDGQWSGRSDFLRRVPIPSNLGRFSYEAEDTKLARKVKANALLQLCAYSEQLYQIQGLQPEKMHVILGDMVRISFYLKDYAAYFRKIKSLFLEATSVKTVDTYPHPVGHCEVCRWQQVCEQCRRQDDHLSLVAGITRDQINKLNSVGIKAVKDLSEAPADRRVPGIGQPVLERLIQQARLQMTQRQQGKVLYEILPPGEADRGLSALPVPTEEDILFDIEGDPFAEDVGLEYLFGVATKIDGEIQYRPFWAHNRGEEKKAFEDLIDFFIERLRINPNLHIYHYASYEPAALKRLMGIHGTREEEVDRLLRGEVLIDLYRVVRQGIRISGESYSLKEIEPLYDISRESEIKTAASSIVAYEQWLEAQDDKILDEIAIYNRDDCFSLGRLQAWLENVRLEAEAQYGQILPRPEPQNPEPSESLAEAETETQELVAALTANIPDDPTERNNEQQAYWLLTQLLGWHRREAKAQWWSYFNLLEMTETELVESSEAIGGLEYEGIIDTVLKSAIHRYRFDPGQDHKIKEGESPIDPVTQKSPGLVHYIDSVGGILDLKRGLKSNVPHPLAVIPPTPFNTKVLRDSLIRVARWVLEHGIDATGPYRASRDLLMGITPRLKHCKQGQPLILKGELPLAAARRLGPLLDETCLPIQGPPGSGKTYTGARMIVDLVRLGKRVGITATSHKAIGNLLKEVCQCANQEGVAVEVIQKADEGQRCEAEHIRHTNKNEDVESAIHGKQVNIAAGTSWLFARPELEGSLDALFIDEAAQMSLANAVAVGGAADNLILLGDPCQLAQPSQGSHPPGAEKSSLEHLLGEHATVPDELGLFLDQTWRLHPDICKFVSEIVYEGRLESDSSCSLQTVGEGPGLHGTGIRFLPVDHHGNRTASTEEVERVLAEVKNLIGRDWIDRRGVKKAITLEDILIVVPYNAQVARMAAFLPHNSRVGTVDKFQGQEAPIVFYSMATSTTEDIPRGLDFLYSLNRLNVAVSRAQGLAVLVCSPDLFRVRCQTPKDMRLVNAFCRLIEYVPNTREPCLS